MQKNIEKENVSMLVETMIIKKVETSIVTSLDVAETFEKAH